MRLCINKHLFQGICVLSSCVYNVTQIFRVPLRSVVCPSPSPSTANGGQVLCVFFGVGGGVGIRQQDTYVLVRSSTH